MAPGSNKTGLLEGIPVDQEEASSNATLSHSLSPAHQKLLEAGESSPSAPLLSHGADAVSKLKLI